MRKVAHACAVGRQEQGSIYPGVVNQAANTVSGSHVYAEAGVYTVKLTVTDAFPVSGELVSEYVVVSNLEAAL